MIMAAGESGCNPLATGILSDIFPEDKRALVMSVFNWGIYGGYGKYIIRRNVKLQPIVVVRAPLSRVK